MPIAKNQGRPTILDEYGQPAFEPVEYLEKRRAALVLHLEDILTRSRHGVQCPKCDTLVSVGDLEMELKTALSMLRLTSLYKVRLDVGGNLGLHREPDLSALSAEDLQALEHGSAELIEAIAEKVKG